MSSMISLLIFSPSIGAIYEDRGGGMSMGSTFLQTFIAISSGNFEKISNKKHNEDLNYIKL